VNNQHLSDQEETLTPIIQRFYDEGTLIEWQRLERHRTEFAVTLCALSEYLPPPPLSLLDIGGGPGRYALALAQNVTGESVQYSQADRKKEALESFSPNASPAYNTPKYQNVPIDSASCYEVALLDLSQGNLEFARQKAQELGVQLHGYVHGNALYLSAFVPESFDAVLLLGPLYHLHNQQERQQALREARRVLRPGGLIFAAFVTRYAPLRDLAKNAPEILYEKQAEWEEILNTGIYRANQGVGFTDAYFAHPDEIRPLLESEGFETLNLIGVEGIVAKNEELVNQLTGEQWEAWVKLNYRLGKEPSLLGAADHVLYVGKKR
jgi:S-adenosylmethionine-dependent methyltransferase